MTILRLANICRLSGLFCLAAVAASMTAVGQGQPEAILTAQGRFNQLYDVGRFAEAVPVAEEVLALIKSRGGETGSEYGAALYQLGNVLVGVSRYAEAEAYLRRALVHFAAQPQLVQPRMQAEVMLATTLVYQSKLDEGVPMMQRLAVAFEATFGINDPRTISTLNNLAQTLQVVGRSAEAEPIYRKLIASLDPNAASNFTNLGTLHANLAAMLTQLGRRDEALVAMRMSVGFLRKIGNPAHKFLAIAVGNLGKLEHDAGNLAVAEAFYRESLEVGGKADGTESEVYAGALINLAVLYRDMGKPADAESSMRQALSIFETKLGPKHPKTGSAMNSLAILLTARGAWAEALPYYDRATEIAVRNAQSIGSDDGRIADTIYGLNPGDFPAHMRAIYNAVADDPKRQEQAFGLAQRSLNSRTAAAVSRMAARAATPGSALAKLIREQQDLLGRRASADQALIATMGAKIDASRVERSAADLSAIEQSLSRVNQQLRTKFPDYVAFDSTQPVALADVQRALKPREALVAFVEVEGNRSVASEVYVWLLTSHTANWRRLDVTSEFIATRVAALRCGLDGAGWRTNQGRTICERLTGNAASQGEEQSRKPLPFDATKAYELYAALFQPLEQELRLADGGWRELLIVASGNLATIPLSVLVTEPPEVRSASPPDQYKRAQWLGKRQAITVLPSITSLTALRSVARRSTATRPMIGFGNPLLNGSGPADSEQAEDARRKQQCSVSASQRLASIVRRASSDIASAIKTRGGLADVALIRAGAPLPETADEICAIARSLGADASDMRLGARATESELKKLSASGRLATYRMLHFATHGVLAGQLQPTSEPGLILTPPNRATDDDDGFLSASEIARLKLNADWVILSACNTAGAQGGTGGTEALSGLARAFFYAGARAVLVSHWEVASQSTVQLVTTTVGAIAKDPRLGRAEALRRAMSAMIASEDSRLAHPSVWAPFIVVGEGAAVE